MDGGQMAGGQLDGGWWIGRGAQAGAAGRRPAYRAGVSGAATRRTRAFCQRAFCQNPDGMDAPRLKSAPFRLPRRARRRRERCA
jgi:hypothetical protein